MDAKVRSVEGHFNMAPLPSNSTDKTTREAFPSSASQRRQAETVAAVDSPTTSRTLEGHGRSDAAAASSGANNATTPSQTGALASPDERGSNPKAAATAQINQLEADVLVKQRASVGVVSKQAISTPGAYQALSSAPTLIPAALSELEGAHLDAAAKQRARSEQANASMSTLESDVLAKQKGRHPLTNNDSAPGAYSARSDTTPTITRSTVMTLPELFTEQEDLLAKQKARHVNHTIDQLDSDVIAKQQGRAAAVLDHHTAVQPGAYESTAPPTGKLAALTQLSDAPADIAAKQRGASGRGNVGVVVPPSALAALSLAEADVLVKDRARREPGMWSQLSAVEADVMAKANAQSRIVSPDDALHTLEDAITNKVLSSHAATSSSANHVESSQKSLFDKDFSALSRDAHQITDGGGRKDYLETGLSDLASETSFTEDRAREKNRHHDDQDLEYGVHGGPNDKGLAVAVAVSEEDGDHYLPSAIEYDPDAKPPILRNRRFQLYGCLAMVVAVVGIVGASVGIVLSSTTTPPPPLPDRATLGIRETMERLVGKDVFNDATHPYRKALDWIMDVDTMALMPTDHKMIQRFLAAYFYFSTSPWSGGCNQPLPGESDDCVLSSLARVDPVTYVDIPGYRWLSGSVDECQWVGVECDVAGQLRTIRLRTWYRACVRAGLSMSRLQWSNVPVNLFHQRA
jgi:hypothetical protein